MSPRARDLLVDTAAANGVTVAEMLGSDRHRKVVKARRQAWVAMRGWGWKQSQIARVANRDASTVSYGLARA